MSLFTRLASLKRNLFRRQRTEADLDAELRSYADLLSDENRAQGLAPDKARRKAQIDFGGIEQVKEQVRDVRVGHYIEMFFRDLRFAFRNVRKYPSFTTIVVLSLALGIGANAAIFSLSDAILFRPIPVPRADNVITVDTAASKLTRYGGSSWLDYLDMVARAKSFSSLCVYQGLSTGMNASTTAPGSKPQNVAGLLVSANYFSTFEIAPVAGRDFLPEEGITPEKYPVVIISYTLWDRVFAKDPAISGKGINLNGHTFTIVGVAPKTFTGADIFYRPDIYVPAAMAAQVTGDGADTLKQRSYRAFEMRGRLNPGVTLAQAQGELNSIMSGLEREHPDSNRDNVAILRTEMGRRMELGMTAVPSLLGGLVVLVLLMACANVASLFMARATSRIKETSTQIALGASRGALVRQLLTESAVLALFGGLAGTALAYICIAGFRSLVPVLGPAEGPDFRLDSRTMICVGVACVVAVLLSGLAPAFMAVKDAWSAVMTTRASASASRSFSSVARRILIGGQIALSVVLLMVGGLFLKSFSRAHSVDLGFNSDRLLLVTIDPLLQGYTNEQAARFHEQLVRRVQSLPGVAFAAVATNVPFVSGASWDISIDGYTAPDGEKFLDITNSAVDPSYFSTMQIPILFGRAFAPTDKRNAPGVAIVNETLASRYITAPGDLSKALGRIMRLRDGKPIQIVGVAKDSSYGGQIGAPPPAVFYLPYDQQGGPRATLVVRMSGNENSSATSVAPDSEASLVVPAIRAAMSELDSEISPVTVDKMTDAISRQGLFLPRIVAFLGGAFGLVAMVLATVGLYGVVSFMVSRRTQEIGIRMTLGAQRGAVLRMVLANGLILASTGLIVGLVIALAAAPTVRSMLVGVSPYDPATFLAISAALLAATAIASYFPAARATRVDPILALRHD
ncbi:MAG TPA: ABC transporter permease [Candidatus Sulfotelmatobacter sp.]|nr:ABC transporter permease [Candidatus Sulfotelmatobacter sp.]